MHMHCCRRQQPGQRMADTSSAGLLLPGLALSAPMLLLAALLPADAESLAWVAPAKLSLLLLLLVLSAELFAAKLISLLPMFGPW